MRRNWQSHTFRAMGSTITLWLDTDEDADAAFAHGEQWFHEAEQQLSRFRIGSELSQLNRRTEQWVEVSALLYEIASRAFDLAQETGGLFDPTLLHALQQAGYDRSFEHIGEGSHPRSIPYALIGKWSGVRLDDRRKAIWLPSRSGLDLGGIAKGYVAEQVCNLLNEFGPCLVDAGGDLVAGDAPTDLPGWPVAVAMPSASSEEQEDALTLWLTNHALATSGIDYRRWSHNGNSQHHIIDPRTGQPVQTNVLTATVLAVDASTAEAWATASLIRSVENSSFELGNHDLAAVLMTEHDAGVITPAMLSMITWQSPKLRLSLVVTEAY
jgi:thiamine biosynthesis lipoprotein